MPGSTGVFRDSDDDRGSVLIQEDELLKKLASRNYKNRELKDYGDYSGRCITKKPASENYKTGS